MRAGDADQEHPRFAPVFTPPQMLQLGVFGGSYFDSGDYEEFPATWRNRAKAVRHEYDASVNLFGVAAGMSLRHWQEKGWIRPADPKGWFQWYCRYYLGRRGPDDEWQIQRWVNYARHVGMLRYHSRNDPKRCLVQRQSLLHWAHDPFADLALGMTPMQKIRLYV